MSAAICPECHGEQQVQYEAVMGSTMSGAWLGEVWADCETCGGDGEIELEDHDE
jgi:hypothetical protein